MRKCGECRLCCELVPVEEILKKAGKRCIHQVDTPGGGCGIYATRPRSCEFYACGYLAMEEARGLDRPDKSHYIIHPQPDTIRMSKDGVITEIPVMVVWVDPKYPDAYKDPKLLYLVNKNKIVVKLAFDAVTARMLIPPSLSSNKKWYEKEVIINWDTPYAKEAIRLGLV